jgi:phospholipid/cholesterol/gamma-HCH transport system permease protein
MAGIIEKLGGFFVGSVTTLILYFYFSWGVIKKALRFRLLNPAIFLVFLRQVYFTGVQILPIVFIVALIFGIALVGFLTELLVNFGAYDKIGQFLTIVIIRELAPFVTAILLALRSSTAVGAEIAVMNLGNEMDTLKSYGISVEDYLFLPRIFAGLVCLFSLSTFFAFVAIFGGYMILSFQLSITFDYLIKLIIDYLTVSDIICFLYKNILLGFFLISIPIFSSIQIKGGSTMIPIALLKGMMRVFYAIIFIEITGAFI